MNEAVCLQSRLRAEPTFFAALGVPAVCEPMVNHRQWGSYLYRRHASKLSEHAIVLGIKRSGRRGDLQLTLFFVLFPLERQRIERASQASEVYIAYDSKRDVLKSTMRS